MSFNQNGQDPVSRRKFLKIGTAAAVVAIVAGVGGYLAYQSGQPRPATQRPATQQPATQAPVTTQAPATTQARTTQAPATTATPYAAPATTQAPATTAATIDRSLYPQQSGGTGPLRYVAATWTVWDGLIEEWKKTYPAGATTEFWDNSIIHVKAIATGGKGWDVGAEATTNAGPVLKSDSIQPIDVDLIPNWRNAWDKGWISETIGPDPKSAIGEVLGEFTLAHMWGVGDPGTEGQKGTKFNKYSRYLPVILNAESWGFNPEFVEHDQFDIASLGLMFDRQFKGRVAFQDDPIIMTDETALHLIKSGQWQPKNSKYSWDLEVNDLEFIVNFLVDEIKAGQFRGYWSDFGAAVNFFVSREVYLSNVWQPVVMFTRHNGVPAYYANSKEGYVWWYGGDWVSRFTDKYDTVMKWMDLRHTGFWTKNIINLFGYSSPTWKSPEDKKAMGPEQYGWVYQKSSTYKSIEELIPGKPERIAKAMFDPFAYKWSFEEGKPNPKGSFLDRGGIPDWQKRMESFLYWGKGEDNYAALWLRTYPVRTQTS